MRVLLLLCAAAAATASRRAQVQSHISAEARQGARLLRYDLADLLRARGHLAGVRDVGITRAIDALTQSTVSHTAHQDKEHPSCKTTVEACKAGCSADASRHDCTEKHTLKGVSVYCCHRPAEHCRASHDDAAKRCKSAAASSRAATTVSATVHKCDENVYCCEAKQCPGIASLLVAEEEAKGTWSGAISSWWNEISSGANGEGTEESPATHPAHAASHTGGATRMSNLKMAVALPPWGTHALSDQKPSSKSSGPGYVQQAYNALDGQLSKIPRLRVWKHPDIPDSPPRARIERHH